MKLMFWIKLQVEIQVMSTRFISKVQNKFEIFVMNEWIIEIAKKRCNFQQFHQYWLNIQHNVCMQHTAHIAMLTQSVAIAMQPASVTHRVFKTQMCFPVYRLVLIPLLLLLLFVNVDRWISCLYTVWINEQYDTKLNDAIVYSRLLLTLYCLYCTRNVTRRNRNCENRRGKAL